MRADAQVIALAPRSAVASLRQRCDDDLMQLAATGMLAAFEELVRRHQASLRAFCTRMLGDPAHGADVAQEVLVQVWRTADRYEPHGRFRPFLMTCARNRCLRALRDRRNTASREQAALSAVPALGADVDADQLDAILAAERQRRLDRVVRQLPPKLREAIALRFGAGLEYREIAEVVGRGEATVRTRVFLGLKRLRGLLGSERSARSLR